MNQILEAILIFLDHFQKVSCIKMLKDFQVLEKLIHCSEGYLAVTSLQSPLLNFNVLLSDISAFKDTNTLEHYYQLQ